ncbi:hypothetical protein DC429_18880 [Arthrobacter sp. TPD3018]|jgi:hypothetical protein|uniref:Uncharacterized protein n=2 Tax=cellular organisms TaxID=131567 RepID=A0A558RE50_9SPHN|nr:MULTISPECIES: hypothetical protein [Sphingomonas]PVE49743.1 hypothetical protein DC429_18880 [Arthrobacter sp. TPD3018]PVE49903.1 hypothetical protein DC425_18800 [Sphingomonas sp. TPD3009]PVE79252.1 hypothetical protein DC431_17785 [Sphingomonas melonis]MBI0477407.1 hypothetical protein [Sphingomonas sp. MA1305]MCP8892459.1 hypothetical protein [Sphingomonas faeni]
MALIQGAAIMDQATTDYYVKREQQERELAASAADPAIAAIHLNMAERYAKLVHADSNRGR